MRHPCVTLQCDLWRREVNALASAFAPTGLSPLPSSPVKEVSSCYLYRWGDWGSARNAWSHSGKKEQRQTLGLGMRIPSGMISHFPTLCFFIKNHTVLSFWRPRKKRWNVDGNLQALIPQLPEGIRSWNAKSGGQCPQCGQRTLSEALSWFFSIPSWASGCLSFFLSFLC